MENHQKFMMQCLELAQVALKNGDPPVGSIIVHGHEIIGKGMESGRSLNDITNHAEILAVRDTIANGNQHLLTNCKMYTTHEPCIMCSYVIRHHGIPHIIYGASVDFIGGDTSHFSILNTPEVPIWGNPPLVIRGVCATECQHLTRQFMALQK